MTSTHAYVNIILDLVKSLFLFREKNSPTTTREAVEEIVVSCSPLFDEEKVFKVEYDRDYVENSDTEVHCRVTTGENFFSYPNIDSDSDKKDVFMSTDANSDPLHGEHTPHRIKTEKDELLEDHDITTPIRHRLNSFPGSNFEKHKNAFASSTYSNLPSKALNTDTDKVKLNFRKQTPRVMKTPKQLESSREKKLVLDAFEYKEMVDSLPQKRLTCGVCQKKFPDFTKLRRHELQVHLTKEEQSKFRNRALGNLEVKTKVSVACDLCKRNFKDLDALNSHKINHLPPEVITTVEGSPLPHYRCLNCDSLFTDKHKYTTHVRHCESEEAKNNSVLNLLKQRQEERKFLCNKCGQSFRRLNGLQRHDLAIHAKVKNFACQYCDQKFCFKYLKTNHERKHLGVAKVSCDLCGFTFSCKNSLKKHIEGVHENRRHFKCHLCDKSFKTSTARNYHVNTHGNPNGRKRGLNKETDPMKAAAKRRACLSFKKQRRVQELADLTTFNQATEQ